MTWFRVGGAGIPASLKNNMNSVLNKKFGTSGQNYPPKQWPDDVNLLGPLPTKTASGSIASFPDGADTVPVKSCTVAFGPGGGGGTPADPVALVGYSSVNVVNHGKNYIGEIQQGGIDAQNGAEISSNTRVRTGFIRVTPSTQYTAAVNSDNTNLVIYYVIEYSSNDTSSFITGTGKNTPSSTFTTSANTKYIRLTARDTTSINITPTDLSNWQCEKGNTATTFEAYSAETISDSFGQTVLGGQRDLTTDGMDVNRGYFALTDELIDNALTYTYSGKTGIQIQNVFPVNVIRTETDENGASHDVVKRGADSATHYMWFGSSAGNKYLYWIGILDHLNMTLEQWKTWAKTQTIELCYPLQTPTQLTGLTAHDIETNYADNNFYADIQDSTMNVEYRADIALALQAVSSSRGLMMASRPVTQLVGEESDPDQVNELVENDETEQEGEDDAR